MADHLQNIAIIQIVMTLSHLLLGFTLCDFLLGFIGLAVPFIQKLLGCLFISCTFCVKNTATVRSTVFILGGLYPNRLNLYCTIRAFYFCFLICNSRQLQVIALIHTAGNIVTIGYICTFQLISLVGIISPGIILCGFSVVLCHGCCLDQSYRWLLVYTYIFVVSGSLIKGINIISGSINCGFVFTQQSS